MKIETLKVMINDRFLQGEIDKKLRELTLTHNLPDGKEIIEWLQSIFTAHIIKQHKDDLHFLKTLAAQKTYPEMIDIIKNTKNTMEIEYDELKNKVNKTTTGNQILAMFRKQDKRILINSIICHPVMTFIEVITLTDNMIRQLRALYLCGELSKAEFYRSRKRVLKQYATVRRRLIEKRKENNELIQKYK
ncbi:hypothetical protein [Providencia rettgeri]|uniref:hypothetical protein n=1 Tax=Providencia rettgeri TaxID=587 RepID=UPI0014198D2D|nr:hypothetical protein [Providencia rettgeri]NIH07045.1 hypothetical protein [Providencia rettgeri]